MVLLGVLYLAAPEGVDIEAVPDTRPWVLVGIDGDYVKGDANNGDRASAQAVVVVVLLLLLMFLIEVAQYWAFG